MQDVLSMLVPHGHILGPALFAIMSYGVRYLLLVSFFLIFMKPTREHLHSTNHKKPKRRKQFLREIYFSILTVLIFSLLNAALSGYGIISHSFLYFDIADYGWLWFWVSIPLMLILHDALFYWIHRALHWHMLFRRAHYIHHLSTHPTVLTTYSLHPWEAIFEALALMILIFIIPVHPLAFLVFQSISTLLNVYCHCGCDFHPKLRPPPFLSRWIYTPAIHHTHHETGDRNYGLYFSHWDRCMGTLDKTQT